MPYYRRVGDVPPKRHTQFRRPDGGLYAEELMGQEGFSSDSSLLYHRYPPTAIVAAEEFTPPAWSRLPNRPLKPRHFQTHKLDASGADPVLDRQHLLANDDVRLSYVVADRPSPLYQYLSARGQFLEHSPYCERDLRGPDPIQEDGEDVEVLVQHRRGWTRHRYAKHPFDVVGWDGCLYPWAFSIHDFEPITGRVHQPPPVHQTFQGPNFVVCSFVPRKVDYHPLAIPVPYHHHNTDSDEVLFYTGGSYEARRGSGIAQGSISLHPSGFTHGPQPGAVERAIGVDYFDELAVMVDTFRPLDLCEPALSIEDTAYAWTWAGASGRSRESE